MSFKMIYNKVDEIKDYSVYSIIEMMNIEIMFIDHLPNDHDAMSVKEKRIIVLKNGIDELKQDLVLLHEIGHLLFDRGSHCVNHRTEENNADTFMCLYLIHNEIWEYEYFDNYLIYQGVSPKVARQFNERVWQFKRQQILQLSY